MADLASKASPLRKGDCIGLFAPAGPLPSDKLLLEGVEIIESSGFKVKYFDDITKNDGYLAGPDERRVNEFKKLWADKEIKALLAVRGGFGSVRVLASLDFQDIRDNPKILIGFSDLTALLNGIQTKTGLVTFHGPMLSTLVRDKDVSPHNFLHFLTQESFADITPQNLQIVRSGQATGRIMGGNLTNLVHMIGTPFEPKWKNTILFVEDINEPAYKIDRMLTHLKLAGRLDKVAGIILGGFLSSACEIIPDMELVTKRLLEITPDHVPVWANFPVSHGPENCVLPIGIQAVMDSQQKLLSFSESCLMHS